MSRTHHEHREMSREMAKQEVRNITGLSKKLAPRWHNQSPEDQFAIGEQFRRDFKRIRGTYREWKRRLWLLACEQYLFAVDRDEVSGLVSKIRKAGFQTKQTTHALVPILRWLGATSDDRASRWAMGLRFAMLRRRSDQLDDLIAFVDAEGGIERCADKFSELGQISQPPKKSNSNASMLRQAKKILKGRRIASFKAPKDGPSTALALVRRTDHGTYRVKHLLDDQSLINKALKMIVAAKTDHGDTPNKNSR